MESHTGSTNSPIILRTATLAREVLERAKTRRTSWPLPSKFRIRSFQEGAKDPCFAATFAAVAEHMGHISERCENYYCCVSPPPFKECEVAHILKYHSSQAEDLLKAIKTELFKSLINLAKCQGCSSLLVSWHQYTVLNHLFSLTNSAILSMSAQNLMVAVAIRKATMNGENSHTVEQREHASKELFMILPTDLAELPPSEVPNENDKSLFLTEGLPFQAGISASAPVLPASSHSLVQCSPFQAGLSMSAPELQVSTLDLVPDVFIEVCPGTYSVSASSPADRIRQTHVIKIQPGECVNLTFDL